MEGATTRRAAGPVGAVEAGAEAAVMATVAGLEVGAVGR